MSVLKVNSISNTTNAFDVDTSDFAKGYAKAWVNFNGQNTISIRDQFNVSSITDGGVGDYTVNFTVPLENNRYVTNVDIARGVGAASNSNIIISEIDQSSTGYRTTSVRFLALYLGLGGSTTLSTVWDPGACFVSCHASPTAP